MELLNQPILWGVAPWRLVLAAVLIFGGLLSRKLIIAGFKGYLTRLAKKTKAEWDDELVRFVPAPLSALAQIGLWYIAARVLELPNTPPLEIRTYTMQGLEVAVWLSLIWLLFRLVDVLASTMARAADKTDSKMDDQLVPLLRRTLKLVIGITSGVMIAQNLGYSVTSLLASLGVGGLALALAAQDTVANFFGSVVVFTDRPFQVGDWVQFGAIEGTVEEVGFRTTTIRRFDKSSVMVPNSTFSSTPIVNHSRRELRRISMTLGVSYETTGEQMEELLKRLREVVKTHEGLDQGFNFVHFTGFGGSSLDIQVYCFSESTVWTTFLETQEALMLKFMAVVNEMGLEFAFPTQTVYLRDEKWNPGNR
ncbi:MAG: mechanosensitive ion channel family protein [Myxococcota bacterium]